MKAKFTKGGWKVNNNSFTLVHGLKTSEVHNTDEWICYVRGNTNVEMEANAKLIAASPELLQALIKMCEFHEKNASWDKGDNGYYFAKSIIKKATE